MLSANDTIATVLAARPAAVHVLLNHRMHCVGCDVASFDTLAEACAAYGVSVEELLDEVDRLTHTRSSEEKT